MSAPAALPAIKTTLIDVTKCIGCRACQVACKQWNEKEGEETELLGQLGFQNPATLSAKTLTLITAHEIEGDGVGASEDLAWVFTMRRCFHCLEPACESACPTTALERQPDGPTTYDADKCIGCRYCVWACPWGVPTAEWDKLAPKIEKCTHCADRTSQPAPLARNGVALTKEESGRFLETILTPACVKACPADCLRFGTRDDMLAEAHKRIEGQPKKYVDHVYGEHEAGGTSVLYLSAVPFERLGFPKLGTKSYPAFTKTALHAVPPAVMAVGAFLGMAYSVFRKRVDAVAAHAGGGEAHDHHPEFETFGGALWTPFNKLLLWLMGFGAVAFVYRFIVGLGRSTHLSNTYPWGLWIVFDLVWIAVAAGAFAMAGLIYVFQRKDLYSLGRRAVLMGLLSYSFVTVTLIADLGLPWHFYQLGLQAPEQSAMFEVSWCVGLYVTVLLFEFLPIPLERWGLAKAMDAWRKWSGFYVAAAVALFVFMLSRNVLYAAVTLVIFGTLAWLFREAGRRGEPIMLAIAAVTLSTMHQSSLGSLFLLMPDQLARAWWSPMLPVGFFVSSIAAGTALIVLMEVWIAKGWNRPLPLKQLSAVGQVTFWALLVYLVLRAVDLVLGERLFGVFGGGRVALLVGELVLGGLLPLVLLSTASLRARPNVLFWGALLAMLGIVLNRINVVILAQQLKGPWPGSQRASYFPSVTEWAISIGLIAATVFLFGLAARHMPMLTKGEVSEVH